ncbi:MAG TPA: NAD(P)-dependent alcohol dehydrogenase [Anaerolineales bacterium]|nr:NAD(P)-dependent alcohol dehydrogenase [Anaerolineales bacterium]
MKAAVYTEFGPPQVLKLKDVAMPTPRDNEILVKIYAASVNIGDLWARNFKDISPRKFTMPLPLWLPSRLYFGLSKPRVNILGSEFAGIVEATGRDVKRFRKGDPVFGYRGQSMGTYAEYLCMPEDGLVALKPANMTFEQAAVVSYGTLTALNLMRHVNVQPGQKVLINGASGGIGSAAIQLAKYFGAEVTAVCGTQRIEFVKSLGADHVIDYAKEDFTQNGETYDLIFDIPGKSLFSRCKDSLKPDGCILYASFKMKQLIEMLWTSRTDGRKVICALSGEKPEDLLFIKELIEAGKLKSIVDRCYPLEQAAEAHRYVESGQKRGSVVITL